MPKFMIAALLLGSLSACAPQYGNYTKIPDVYNAQMADASAQKLSTLYPPASTHLVLSQIATDAYGVELIKKLRESGYAIEEGNLPFFVATSTPANTGSSNSRSTYKSADPLAPAAWPKTIVSTAGLISKKSIGYIVDQLGTSLYRVTLYIDSTVFSRVYMVSGTGIAPAGSWTRKE